MYMKRTCYDFFCELNDSSIQCNTVLDLFLQNYFFNLIMGNIKQENDLISYKGREAESFANRISPPLFISN